MPDDLGPPVAYENFRWHWITADGERIFPCFWTGQSWNIAGERFTPEEAHRAGFRYLHPCDPAALTINPDDPKLIECIEAALEGVPNYWLRENPNCIHYKALAQNVSLGFSMG